MKKIIFLILASVQVFIVYPQATSGTRVTAPIVPNDSSDVYPTHDAYFGRDGYRSVSTLTERDNIKNGYRKAGMLVYVQADSSYYQLRNGIDNSNWWKPIPIVDTTAEWVARTIYVSMPTDPQTPGSDVTGKGTISLPFATLEKALGTIKTNGIFAPITVQLDSGTFNYNQRCAAKLAQSSSIIIPALNGFYKVNIVGQFVKETSYPTLTFTQKTIFGVYTVTGYTFTENELADKFLGNTGGTVFYPVESNRNDTVIIPFTGTNTLYTYIYRPNTSITLTSDVFDLSFDNSLPNINFQNLKISSPSSHTISGTVLTNVLYDVVATGSVYTGLANTRVANSKIKSDPSNTFYTIGILNNNCVFQNSIVYKKTSRKTAGNGIYNVYAAYYSNFIVSGFLYGIACKSQNKLLPFSSTSNSNVLFKDCTNAFANNLDNASAIVSLDFNCNMLFTNYLFYSFSSTSPVSFATSSFLSNKLLAIYNPSSLYKSFVREDLGGYINGLGLYTEVQRKLSATLVNNTTDSISIGDKSYNRTIELKYTALRGSTYRKGTLEIINTGSGLLFNPGSYFPVTDIGLTFTGAAYSGSSNTIKLKYTVDNTGGNVTITYDAFRQNY